MAWVWDIAVDRVEQAECLGRFPKEQRANIGGEADATEVGDDRLGTDCWKTGVTGRYTVSWRWPHKSSNLVRHKRKSRNV
jgi:hypothetical protein